MSGDENKIFVTLLAQMATPVGGHGADWYGEKLNRSSIYELANLPSFYSRRSRESRGGRNLKPFVSLRISEFTNSRSFFENSFPVPHNSTILSSSILTGVRLKGSISQS